jgi:hypothetical protein
MDNLRICKVDSNHRLKANVESLSPLFQENLKGVTSLDMKNDEIINELTNLFNIIVQQNLNLNIRPHDDFVDSKKYFTIIILKDNSIVFLKNKMPNIDIVQLCKSIDLFQNLTSEIVQTHDIFHPINFHGGNFQVAIFDSFKYILFSTNNTIYSRIKLRKFIVETINVARTIPILEIPNKEDVKQLNNLAKELFGI